jgi:hypothetical protein
MTMEMVAEVFGVSKRTVFNLRKSGDLVFRTIGKRPMMTKRDLVEFIESRGKK